MKKPMSSKTKKSLGIVLIVAALIGGGIAIYSSRNKKTAPRSMSIDFETMMADTWGVVTFGATVEGGTAPYTANWEFGDGSNTNELMPTHTYINAGTYSVKLTITDSKGVSASATHSFELKQDGTIDNSFSVSIGCDSDGLTVHFISKENGGTPPFTHNWNLGDGTTSTEAAFDHTYTPNPLVPAGTDWRDNIIAFQTSSLVKDAGDHVSHPTAFRLGNIDYTWDEWLNDITLSGIIAHRYVQYMAGTWDVGSGGALEMVKYWGAKVTGEACPTLTKSKMTLNDFACGLIIAEELTIEILGDMGAAATANPVYSQWQIQAQNTFRGVATLKVTDSAGKTAEASADINVTAQDVV